MKKKSKKIIKYIIALCTLLTAIIGIISQILSIVSTQHNGSASNYNTNNTTGNSYHFGDGNSFGNNNFFGDNISIENNNFFPSRSPSISDFSLNLTEINLSYLKREELKNSTIYQLNYIDFAASEKTYYMSNESATALTLYNNSNSEIAIKEISFVAENISPLTLPELSIYPIYNELGINLIIYNKSITDIHNVFFDFSNNEQLKTFFNEEDLKYYLPEIKGLCDYHIIVLPNEKLLYYPEDIIYIEPLSIEVHFDEGQQSILSSIGIAPNGMLGMEIGGIGNSAYGILLDTTNPDYTFSQTVLESVPPKHHLTIPVIFFCDCTCNFDFYIKVLVSNGSNEFWIESEHKNAFIELDYFSASDLPQSTTFEFIPSESSDNFPFMDIYN